MTMGKERSPELIRTEKECSQLCRPQVARRYSEFLAVVVGSLQTEISSSSSLFFVKRGKECEFTFCFYGTWY